MDTSVAEIPGTEKVAVDDYDISRWMVYDLLGSTIDDVAGVDWELLNANGSVLDSGEAVVNNADTDVNGDSIKTFAVAMDLGSTDLVAGKYYVLYIITLTTGQRRHFRRRLSVFDPRSPDQR